MPLRRRRLSVTLQKVPNNEIPQTFLNLMTVHVALKGRLTTEQTLKLAQAMAQKRFKIQGPEEGYEALLLYIQILIVSKYCYITETYICAPYITDGSTSSIFW